MKGSREKLLEAELKTEWLRRRTAKSENRYLVTNLQREFVTIRGLQPSQVGNLPHIGVAEPSNNNSATSIDWCACVFRDGSVLILKSQVCFRGTGIVRLAIVSRSNW